MQVRLQDGAVLSDDDIREEVDTFMFEGHDTTSAAISWCTFLIGCDNQVQRQVHAELDDIFADDPERAVTMKDLAEMKYLECCIKEALRLYPSVPAFARALKEDVQIANYTVPAGTTAMLVIYMLHRNAEVGSSVRWPVRNGDRIDIVSTADRRRLTGSACSVKLGKVGRSTVSVRGSGPRATPCCPDRCDGGRLRARLIQLFPVSL